MALLESIRAAVHVMPFNADISIVGPEASRVATTNPDYLPRTPFALVTNRGRPPSPASTQPWASYNPIAFRELAMLDGRLRSMRSPNGPVIFMGTVHRPDGAPRLVIITGELERDSSSMFHSVGAAVLPLPGWFDPLPPALGTPFNVYSLVSDPGFSGTGRSEPRGGVPERDDSIPRTLRTSSSHTR